jgi:hypothetical protein
MGDHGVKRRLPGMPFTTNPRRTLMHPTPFTIRAATARDEHVLARLATLDSQRTLRAPALIAEIAGHPAAAIDLKTSRVVADPFQPTIGLTEHLRLEAASLCGPPPRWPRGSRIGAVAALVATGMLLIASQAGAATPPDLAATKISGTPASLATNATARLDVTVANRGGRAGKATKTDVLLSTDRRRGKDIRIARIATKAFASHAKRRLRAGVKLPPGIAPGGYFVLACADATARLRERHERDNCRVGAALKVVAPVSAPPAPPAPPSPAPGAPALALHLADGIDWSRGSVEGGALPKSDTVLTATARIGDGIAGQAGYDQTYVDPHGPVEGETTTLDFGTRKDDGAAPVDLPFAFPFGGIAYDKAFVSTNGAISFGEHLADYYVDTQLTEYRGPGAVLSEFTRALFPYFTDLDTAPVGAPAGTVTVTHASDGSVAMRWQESDQRQPELRRDVQAVLFADGRIRFDYLGSNEATADPTDFAAIGLSTGTGSEALDALTLGTRKPPSRSVLYTPHAVEAAPVPEGVVRLLTPRATSFVSADPGCTLVRDATPSANGVVECSTPALSPGESRTVSARYMRGAIDKAGGRENQHLIGEWRLGGVRLEDADEADLAGSTPVDPDTTVQLTPATSTVLAGELQTLHYAVTGDRLAAPTVTIHVPAGTEIVSTTLQRCSALPQGTTGGDIVCLPGDGGALIAGDLVIKAAPNAQQIAASLDSDNGQPTTEQWLVTGE